MGPASRTRDHARLRWLLTVAFVGTLFVPLVTGHDGVPLSTYPMYASPRPSVITFVVPHATDADGSEVALSTQQIAATRDPLVAESWLDNAVADGRAGAACAEIAGRLVESAAVTVEIRLDRHDVVERVLGERSLVSSELVTSCEVPR